MNPGWQHHCGARLLYLAALATVAASSLGCAKKEGSSEKTAVSTTGSAGASAAAQNAASATKPEKGAIPTDLPDLPTEEDYTEQVKAEVPEGADLAAELDVLQKEIAGSP